MCFRTFKEENSWFNIAYKYFRTVLLCLQVVEKGVFGSVLWRRCASNTLWSVMVSQTALTWWMKRIAVRTHAVCYSLKRLITFLGCWGAKSVKVKRLYAFYRQKDLVIPLVPLSVCLWHQFPSFLIFCLLLFTSWDVCCSHPKILAVCLVTLFLFFFFFLFSFSLLALVPLYFYSLEIFDFFSQVSLTSFHTGITHSCLLLIFSLISTYLFFGKCLMFYCK